MSGFNLRKRARVCYYEPEEPPFDEFIFCTECRDYVYEYCAIHGPLLVIPDDKVSARAGLPAWVPRAALTVPRVFLHLARSRIPEAGIGVFSSLTLPRGVRFGPYRGRRVRDPGDSCYGWQVRHTRVAHSIHTHGHPSPYCPQIYDRDRRPLHVVDARDANNSNWMRYVNCSRHHSIHELYTHGHPSHYCPQIYDRDRRPLHVVDARDANNSNWMRYVNCSRHHSILELYTHGHPSHYCPQIYDRDRRPLHVVDARDANNSNWMRYVNCSRHHSIHELYTHGHPSHYCPQIYDRDRRPLHVVDARDANNSNWMRYVNCSRHHAEQNLVAYQYQGELYYRTVKVVPRFTELLVFYGSEFAASLGVQLRAYRKPCPCDRCQAQLVKKSEQAKTIKRQTQVEQKKETPVNENIVQTQLPKKKESAIPKKRQARVVDKNETPTNEDVGQTQPAKTKESKSYNKRVRTEEKNEKLIVENVVKDNPVEKIESSKSSQVGLLKNTDIQEGSPEKPTESNGLSNTLIKTNFKCNDCGKVYNVRSDLEIHLQTHFVSKVSTSKDINSNTHFACNKCSSTFNTRLLLVKHGKDQHGDKCFACEQCEYATKYACNLQNHVRTHTGERPFKCSQCNIKFTHISGLKCHQRIHTGEKPFKCNECGASFTQKIHLTCHQTKHTGVKAYECNICDYKAAQSSALKRHLMSIHSGQKPYGCDTCSYRTAIKGELTRHMKKHHKSA